MKEMILLIFLVLIVASCRKREGCMDRLASNYDSRANKQGFCSYEGKVVLWKDTERPNEFANDLLK